MNHPADRQEEQRASTGVRGAPLFDRRGRNCPTGFRPVSDQETTTEPAQPADTRSTTLVAREASLSATFRPTTLAAAFDALQARPDALLLAGGTDVMVEVNARRCRPAAVVAVRRVQELQGYTVSPHEVTIGATTTWSEIEHELADVLPALAAAARTVGSPQIRAAATLGGNLGTFRAAGVSLPVLLGLDAAVTVARRGQERKIPMAGFASGSRALAPGEIMTTIHVPRLRGPQQFLKLGARNAMTESVCSVLVALDLTTRAVRVAVGAVSPAPWRATEAEHFLAEALDWGGPGVRAGELVRFGALVAERTRTAAAGPHAAYQAQVAGVLAIRGAQRCLAAEATS